MSHNHHHHHNATGNIKVAFFINLSFTLIELIGGFFVNSVAILSDAIHDLGDSISLGLSWYLENKSTTKADKAFSFGYSRFSLLGALINSIILILGSVFILSEAIDRIINPEYSNALGMVGLAVLGVLANGAAVFKLKMGSSLNEKVLTWHLMEDVLGWVIVLISAIVLNFWNTPYLDPTLSIFITLYILWNVIKRLKDTLYIFLQGNPKQKEIPKITAQLSELNHVANIHHTHIWSLDGEKNIFTTHIKLEDDVQNKDVFHLKNEIKELLQPYGFYHMTIETEFNEEACCNYDPVNQKVLQSHIH